MSSLFDGQTNADALRFDPQGLPPQLVADIYYIHTDQLATPRAITDSSGKVVWRWESDPFGTTPANEDADGDGNGFVYNPRFPGQYFDAETALHYNYFRDYDPGTGRYVESDPVGLGGGQNPYLYVKANPISSYDYYGLAPKYRPRPPGPKFEPDLTGLKSNPLHGKLADEWTNSIPSGDEITNWQYAYVWVCRTPDKGMQCDKTFGEDVVIRTSWVNYKPYDGILDCKRMNRERLKFHTFDPSQIPYSLKQYKVGEGWVSPPQYFIRAD